jgi:glycopeptide antibiotics resistance protein
LLQKFWRAAFITFPYYHMLLNVVYFVHFGGLFYKFYPRRILVTLLVLGGYMVAQLVEALHYKPEGHGFDSRWRHWNFSLT